MMAPLPIVSSTLPPSDRGLICDTAQTLLNFLDEKDLRATFFAVGSRVIERPNVLIEEYMKGHEIAVHTWSHHVIIQRCPPLNVFITCL